jgi:hypothetical protein
MEDFVNDDGTEATGELMKKKKKEAAAKQGKMNADDILGIKQKIEAKVKIVVHAPLFFLSV